MPNLDRQAILDVVHDLPLDEQLDIAREILRAVDVEQADDLMQVILRLATVRQWLKAAPARPIQRTTAASLRGIAKMDNPPDDATAVRWMDEHRTEKYGS